MAKKKYSGDKYLQYVTKRDGRVRHSHLILDWVIKRVDDPFWKIYTPPNGWRCRCSLRKLQGSGIRSTNTIHLNLHKEVPDIFQFNAGEERTVVNKKKHPYFKVPKKDEALWKKNFNLPKLKK